MKSPAGAGLLRAGNRLPSAAREPKTGNSEAEQRERGGLGNCYLRGNQRNIDENPRRVLSQNVVERKRRGAGGNRLEVEESQHSVARGARSRTKKRIKHELDRS